MRAYLSPPATPTSPSSTLLFQTRPWTRKSVAAMHKQLPPPPHAHHDKIIIPDNTEETRNVQETETRERKSN